MKCINILVDLKKNSYPIHIGSLFDTSLRSKMCLPKDSVVKFSEYLSKKVLIVTNDIVAPLYLEKIITILKDTYDKDSKQYVLEVLILPDGEQYKNFESLNAILSKMLECQFSRSSLLIALGGGVIGDMVGFAASIYQRGMDFIQIPTTLLSQVDSSVGGKTGINHILGKNMIGAFKQPKCVIIDPSVLNTLSTIDFSSGMAEVIKYGLIRDAFFFDWLEENATEILNKNPEILVQMIARSIQNKVDVVQIDEFEIGERALLNLGHTFGHSIEKIQRYKGLSHGQAVSVGIMMALRVSLFLGDILENEYARIEALLRVFSLPVVSPNGITVTDMLSAMALDKKNINGRIRLILLKKIGLSYISESVDIDLVTQAMCELGVVG